MPRVEINPHPASCMASCAVSSQRYQAFADVPNKYNHVSINSITMASEINSKSFQQTVLLAFLLPLTLSLSRSLSTFPRFSALSTNSNTLSCTKWMGLLCWSLFSSVESSSSLTSTTSMEGMSVFPSLYSHVLPSCWALVSNSHRLPILGIIKCVDKSLVSLHLDPDTHPFHSTWFPWRCHGTVTSALLCSWPPSSIGSP